MNGRISAIERVGDGAYRVIFENTTRELISRFTFTIGQDEHEMVRWNEEFDTYMGSPPWHLNPLFKAVLALHYAQTLDLPLRK